MYLEFEVLTAVIMNSTIIWYVMPCSPLSTDVSEEHIAFIFRVEELAKQETSVKACLLAYSTQKMEAMCSLKCQLTSNGFYGLICQKIVLFM
jgi:hypothetical protein